jgi:cytochrome c biogenesis protein ResB
MTTHPENHNVDHTSPNFGSRFSKFAVMASTWFGELLLGAVISTSVCIITVEPALGIEAGRPGREKT